MSESRIIDLTAKQSLESGDYFVVDNETGGTKKLDFKKLPMGRVFDTMPSNAELLAMDDGLFFTKGFYSVTDDCGGFYDLRSSATGGSLPIKNNGTAEKWLVALSGDSSNSQEIDICRYGLRQYSNSTTIDFSTLTPENTYADLNSQIISDVLSTSHSVESTIKFRHGKFFFEEPINIVSGGMSICGEPMVSWRGTYRLSYYNYGTALCFPFLANGQAGITQGLGNIENLYIAGNSDVYDFSIDRTKTITAPNEVVTETVREESGNEIKCKGIYKTGSGRIRNVCIINFYTGLNASTNNVYINNIYARKCHFGISIGGDTKCVGVYGWDIHTLLKITGSISSAISVRADSCVNLINIIRGDGITLMDVDGDYCTENLILCGDGQTWGTINYLTAYGVHGRCCTLKAYDSVNDTPPKISDLGDDTSGYGYVRVLTNCGLIKSKIQLAVNAANPFDSDSNYRCPYIILTYPKGHTFTQRNIFDIPSILMGSDISNPNVQENPQDILDLFQTHENFTARVNTSENSYFIKGKNTIKGFVKES